MLVTLPGHDGIVESCLALFFWAFSCAARSETLLSVKNKHVSTYIPSPLPGHYLVLWKAARAHKQSNK